MKKSYMLMIVILLSCFLFACNNLEDPKMKEDEGNEVKMATFIGKIEGIYGQKSGLVIVEEGGILQSSNRVWVSLSVNSTETFQVGDKVKVGYDGEIKESNPAQINTLSIERVE